MSMNPEELKRMRRRQRRTERKAAAQAGIPVDAYRKTHGSETSTPAMRMGVPSQKTQAALFKTLSEYTDYLVEALELEIDPKPQDSFWLGFSLAEIMRLHPDPVDGANAILQRATERQVPIRRIAIFKGQSLGIGPIKSAYDED